MKLREALQEEKTPKTKELVMKKRDGTVTARVKGYRHWDKDGKAVYVSIPKKEDDE